MNLSFDEIAYRNRNLDRAGSGFGAGSGDGFGDGRGYSNGTGKG